MRSTTFNLQARPQVSSTLMAWLAGRDGATHRAGIVPGPAPQAAGENAVTTGLTAEQLMQVLSVGNLTAAGVPVTPEVAMRQSTVYGCVALLSGAAAALPVGVFERVDDTRRKASHDYWWFLNEQANEDMSTFTAWQYLISGKLFYGDGFAELLRPSAASSRVIGWKPLHPLRVQPFVSTGAGSEGRLYYRVTPANGAPYVLDPADMIHLPSLGFDGLTSPSPITYAAREAIGAALAAENYSARFFNGGASFDYALKTAAKLDKTQLENLYLSLSMRTQQNGPRAPLILTGGLEPATLSWNLRDSEIVALRLLGVEEICRIFGVPPHLVGHTQKSTSWGTGLEEQGASFVRYTLQQLLTPIAQEFNRKLWPTRSRYFVEHITAALERGNLKARYEAYRVALGRAGEMPFMDADEIRRNENMPPNPNLQRNEGSSTYAPPTDPAAE